MPKIEIVSHIYIKINGKEIADPVLSHLLEVTVDQHVHLPGMFTVRLYDSDFALIDVGPFDLQSKIEIASKTPDGKEAILIKGEVTALEPQFGEGMIAELLVRGYDQMHRLYRETKSKTYLNVKDSDLATEIASKAKLSAEVEATRTVYDHIYQNNQSDLSFLMQRAWRIGYECFIEDEKKLIFRKPSSAEPKVKLTWGDDLLSFTPRMTLTEQVEKVVVKGWDVQQRAAIIGQADKGVLYPKAGEKELATEKLGKKLASGGKMVIVDQAVVSQAEADILAAARLNELSGAFVEAEGTAFRRPDIRAGQVAKLEGLGKRFSGNYLVTSATHVYTNAGFKTTFSVCGLRNGLLLSQITQPPGGDRWPGVAPAIVTNTDDPQKWGRIKVKYPWMSDEDESDWVRVATPGAGPDAGFCLIPAVQDEVLVAFIHGHFNQPVVVGSLWNGQASLPKDVLDAPESEKPKVRSWRSRTGHRITTYDNTKNKIEVMSAEGHQITLDDSGKKIEIKSSGGLSITLNDSSKEIKIDSSGKVTVNGSLGVRIESGANLELQAAEQVTIKGKMIQLN